MRFADVIGQEEVKAMLRRSVGEGRVSHAQLFTGDSGRGTLPLALAYVQYINCTDRHDGDSCGRCPSCIKMAELVHPDVHFVFPTNTSRSGSQKPMSDAFLPQWREAVLTTGGYFDEQMWYGRIGLDNQQGLIAKREADEIIRKLSFKAFEAEYKAVVIWLPEKMGVEASNGLLKILEEPWDKTLFLLVSVAPQMLLPTILSRVQEVGVPPVGADDMERWLAGTYGMETQKAAALARLAGASCVSVTTTGTWSCWDGPRIWRRWGAKPRNVFSGMQFPCCGKVTCFRQEWEIYPIFGDGKGSSAKSSPLS